MTSSIQIVPYDPHWPHVFEKEAEIIKNVLGDNCVGVHHIGSTAIPGLSAKPIIDMIPVVRDITQVDHCNSSMEAWGYQAMGEYGIPLRRYFQKGSEVRTHHVHVYEQNNSEIERHLKFRDWMRTHYKDVCTYAHLKKKLAIQFKEDIFSYCLGKEDFIRSIDEKAGWSGFRLVTAATPRELEAAKHFRNIHFLTDCDIDDAHARTFNHEEYAHLILYHGIDIIGYAYIHFLPDQKALIRMLAIDEKNQNAKREFLSLIEKWLNTLELKIIYSESIKNNF